LQKVTLIPRGQGLTWFTPTRVPVLSYWQNYSYLGRSGGRSIFGKVTTGAGQDLQQVTSLARQMVTKFGMSDLGPLSLESQNNEVFFRTRLDDAIGIF